MFRQTPGFGDNLAYLVHVDSSDVSKFFNLINVLAYDLHSLVSRLGDKNNAGHIR